MFGGCYFQMIKQKFSELPEDLGQLSYLNIGFDSVLLLLVDIYSSKLFL